MYIWREMELSSHFTGILFILVLTVFISCINLYYHFFQQSLSCHLSQHSRHCSLNASWNLWFSLVLHWYWYVILLFHCSLLMPCALFLELTTTNTHLGLGRKTALLEFGLKYYSSPFFSMLCCYFGMGALRSHKNICGASIKRSSNADSK